MTLREKFENDGTAVRNVAGLAIECLDQSVVELGSTRRITVSRLECGDYLVDDRSSGDTILIESADLAEPQHADVRELLAEAHGVYNYELRPAGYRTQYEREIEGEAGKLIDMLSIAFGGRSQLPDAVIGLAIRGRINNAGLSEQDGLTLARECAHEVEIRWTDDRTGEITPGLDESSVLSGILGAMRMDKHLKFIVSSEALGIEGYDSIRSLWWNLLVEHQQNTELGTRMSEMSLEHGEAAVQSALFSVGAASNFEDAARTALDDVARSCYRPMAGRR